MSRRLRICMLAAAIGIIAVAYAWLLCGYPASRDALLPARGHTVAEDWLGP